MPRARSTTDARVDAAAAAIHRLRLQHARRVLREAQAQLRRGEVPGIIDEADTRFLRTVGATLDRLLPERQRGSLTLIHQLSVRLGPGWSAPMLYAVRRLAGADLADADLDRPWSVVKAGLYGKPASHRSQSSRD